MHVSLFFHNYVGVSEKILLSKKRPWFLSENEGFLVTNYVFSFRDVIFFINFDYVEDTLARKCSNKFGILLAYSYLCTRNDTEEAVDTEL